MLEQTLSGTHARECHGLHRDTAVGADARIGRRLQRARLGEIVAVVCAARILARDGRLGDDATDADQALEVEPVVPAQVERTRLRADTGPVELRVELVELAKRTRQTSGVADDADALPHRVVELLA